MNKDKMIQWAEALESGKYEQYQGGWGGSKYGNKFCCLNVALVEFGEEEHENHPCPESTLESIFDWTDDLPASYFFTDEEFNKLQTGDQNSGEMTNHFITCNDHLQLTFPQIAEKIRKFVDEQG